MGASPNGRHDQNSTRLVCFTAAKVGSSLPIFYCSNPDCGEPLIREKVMEAVAQAIEVHEEGLEAFYKPRPLTSPRARLAKLAKDLSSPLALIFGCVV